MWTAKTNQTGRMPRLLRVFAGHRSFRWFCLSLANLSTNFSNYCLHYYYLSKKRAKIISTRHTFSACGYCGSDGVVVMVLQRYAEAKRVYATIIDCKAQVKTPMYGGNFNLNILLKQLQWVFDDSYGMQENFPLIIIIISILGL